MKRPELVLLPDIMDLCAADLVDRKVGLLGLDMENVLTDYQDTAVRPEVAGHLGGLASDSVQTDFVIITNKKDEGFIKEVSEQIGGAPFYFPKDGLRGKTTSDLFEAAARDFDLVNPWSDNYRFTAAHLDDQVKNYRGIKRARGNAWQTFFWTRPYGERQHLGVRAARPAERVFWHGVRLGRWATSRTAE